MVTAPRRKHIFIILSLPVFLEIGQVILLFNGLFLTVQNNQRVKNVIITTTQSKHSSFGRAGHSVVVPTPAPHAPWLQGLVL